MNEEEVTLLNAEGVRTCTVYGSEESTGQKEFFAAEQSGFKGEKKVTVYSEEYSDEPMTEIGGKRYAIYRTYVRRDGRTELYLTSRIGV